MPWKKLLAMGIAVLFASLLMAGATFAYFTAQTGPQRNVVTIGKVEVNLLNTDLLRTITLGSNETYSLTPTIRVEEGSASCYIRLRVKVDNELLRMIQMPAGEAGFVRAQRTDLKGGEAGYSYYDYYYTQAVDPGSFVVFKQIQTNHTNPDDLPDKRILMNFDAHAIQSAGFADYEKAFAYFDAQRATP